MQFACPNCGNLLEFAERRPAFCSFCGTSLPAPDPHEAATIAGPAPLASDGVAQGAPQTVGEFVLLRKLGQGGMGSVWEAEQRGTGRRVAVKLLAADLPRTNETTERFVREARLAAAVSHPRSTFVFGVGEEQGRPYIVMELMPGHTLKDVVDKEGKLPVPKAVDYILDVIEGLSAAHALGVVHRDVKPSNCFFDSDGRLKVGDYGLSRSLLADSQLTRTGAFLGTPAFAAPEQVRGGTVTEQTDLYSVGATLFYLVAGRAPFQGDAAGVIAQIVSDPAPHIRSVCADAPRDFDLVLAKALAKDPTRRFASLPQFRQALLPFASGGNVMGDFGRRVAAFMVDNVLTTIVISIFVSIAGPILLIATLARSNKPDLNFSLAASMWPLQFAGWALTIAYFVISEGVWGRTLGKRIMGLRVAGPGGGPPGLARAFVRTLFIPGAAQGVALLLQLGDWNVAASLANLATYPVFALCALTMRARNGHRGLHDLASRSRVVRLHRFTATLAADDVPAVAPVALDGGDRIYGPYRITGSLGPNSGAATVLTGRDDVLERSVWIYRETTDTGQFATARLCAGRPTRPRWLQRGEGENQRWNAFEAVVGSPLCQVVANAKGLTWNKRQPLLSDLAQELAAAALDGTLPETLTLDQVWVDRGGRIKLLDAPIETGGNLQTSARQGGPSSVECAVALLSAAVEVLSRGQLPPRHALDFVTELQARPASAETLSWAADALRESAGRRGILKADDRFGLLCCSSGTEGALYVITMMCVAVVCLAIGLAFGKGGLSVSGSAALAALATASFLIASLGYWLRGGPVFRLLGIDVLRLDGRPASRARCAVRSVIAWAPQLTTYALVFAVLVSPIGAAPAGGVPPVADIRDNLRLNLVEPVQLIGLVCSLALLGWIHIIGVIWALVRPQRGLQDRLVRTYLAPR